MRETIYRFGGFELKSSERILRRNRALVPLPPKAIATLLFLLEADGRVVSKAELLDAVWPGTFVDEGNLPQTISVLRKGLDPGFPDSSPIETVARVGYMFRAAVEVVTSPDPGQGTPEILPAASPGLPSDAPGEIPVEPLTPADTPLSMQLSPSRPASHNLYMVALILGCLALALLIFLPLRSFFRSPQPASRAFSTPVPLTAGSGWEFSPAISPDGKTLAYSARRDGEAAYSIYLKHLGSGEDGQRLHTGPGSAFHAAWSPDGKRIAFFSAALHANWLQILDLDTGAIHKVLQLPEWGAPAPLPISESYWVGPIWTRDAASLIYSHNPGIGSASVLEQIDLASGRVRRLTHNTDGWYDGSPALSPDGRSIAFIHNLNGQARLEVLSLQTLQRTVVSEPWHLLDGAAWMPDGRSLVVAGSRNGGPDGTRWAIWRVRLDGRFTQLVQDRPDMIVDPAVSAIG